MDQAVYENATMSHFGLASEAAAQTADESKVSVLGAQGGAELAGGDAAYRHDWGDRNGQWVLNLNWGSVNRNSMVFVSIAEGAPGGGKFVGAARYTVHNVAPGDGRVTIWVNIEHSEPIRLLVDYLVINNPNF